MAIRGHTRYTSTHVFFYRKESPFSQFYPCEFFTGHDNEPILRFTSAEQYMMYQKALLFDDVVIALDILKEDDPAKCKKLGRKVKNFNYNTWETQRRYIVSDGNALKFYTNQKLFSYLLTVGNRELVEASPSDSIWGIGMGMDNVNLNDHTLWGQNLLGKVLTNIKDYAIKNTKEAIRW